MLQIRTFSWIVLLFCLFGVGGFAGAQEAGPPAFVPEPTRVNLGSGEVVLDATTRVLFETRDAPRDIETTLEPLSHVLAGELEMLTGHRPAVAALGAGDAPDGNDIVLRFHGSRRLVASEEDEDQSYRLTVNRRGIVVESQYYKGVAYGTATLLQGLRETDAGVAVPVMRIEDQPAATYRAVMIDVARQVHSIETLKEVVRMARLYKIRYIQLHLTDDQNFTFPFTPVTDNIENNFAYPREALVDLVAYADARGVTLIPELDLPGHSSKLKASGYLNASANDADVADPVNYEKIAAIIDDILEVFHTSPYFHIGGDESGAGEKLVPFLAAMNRHLRSRPADRRPRMMVWEGFHGGPVDQLPSVGPDRIIVHSWESSYNAPWDLLDHGYTLINSSWMPMYVVGNGTLWHPGKTVRMWSPQTLYAWHKDLFMHWDPHRPTYNDQDPDPNGDRNRNDHQWNAAENNQQNLVIGGQLIFWEQHERTVVNDLRDRLPAVAERLWNPSRRASFEGFQQRLASVDPMVMTIVRPVEILPALAEDAGPIGIIYRPYTGDQVTVTLRNRTKIPGTIRYTLGSFSNSFTYLTFGNIPPITAESTRYEGPFQQAGGFGIRAQLFREDGTPVDGTDWQDFCNWPNTVRVTEYDTDERVLEEVPDLTRLPDRRVIRRYGLPFLRGPINHTRIIGQVFEATLVAPGTGTYELTAQTVRGRMNVYIDLNGDGEWTAGERLFTNTPRDETQMTAPVELTQGVSYAVRVDHAAAQYGPLVWLHIDGPGTDGKKDMSYFFAPLDED